MINLHNTIIIFDNTKLIITLLIYNSFDTLLFYLINFYFKSNTILNNEAITKEGAKY